MPSKTPPPTLTPAFPLWPLVAVDSSGSSADSQSCLLSRLASERRWNISSFPSGGADVREDVDFSFNKKSLKIGNTYFCVFK